MEGTVGARTFPIYSDVFDTNGTLLTADTMDYRDNTQPNKPRQREHLIIWDKFFHLSLVGTSGTKGSTKGNWSGVNNPHYAGCGPGMLLEFDIDCSKMGQSTYDNTLVTPASNYQNHLYFFFAPAIVPNIPVPSITFEALFADG